MRRAALVWPLALLALAAPQLLAQTQQAPPAQTPDTAPKGSGIISGRVVDATSGQPVTDAIVTMNGRGPGVARGVAPQARGGGPPMPQRGGPAPAPLRQITSSDGRFVFHSLAPGTYSFTVTAPGYLIGGGRGAAPSLPGLQPITLVDGERRGDVQVRLSKPAVMSGTVVDDAGEPAVGVSVRMMRRTWAAGRPRYSAWSSARTDDRGMYRAASLVPGDYFAAVVETRTTMPAATINSIMQSMASSMGGGNALIEMMSQGAAADGGLRIGDHLLSTSAGTQPVLSRDGRLLVHQSVFYPSATSLAEATVIKLGSGEERSGVDIQLRLLSSARVDGTVTGPLGPVGGVEVRLLSAGDDAGAGAEGELDAAHATSGADGSFVLLGVPPGRYVARVIKPPREPLPAEFAAGGLGAVALEMLGKPGPNDKLMLFGEVSITVGGTDVTGVAIPLSEGYTLSGRLEFEGAAPRPPPQQLASMTVLLSPGDGRTALSGGRDTRLDDQGKFKTSGYAPGRYFIATSLVGDGPVTWQLKSVTAGGRDAFSAPLEIRDADVSDIVITYTDRIGQMEGKVRNAAGALAANASVVLFPADYRAWIANGMNPRRLRTARSGSTGTYVLINLVAGDYLIGVAAEGETIDPQNPTFIEAIAATATRVTLGEAEKRSMDLQIGRGGR